ncbi:MAG TPA: maltose alpha-D-glucosyltransferase [Chloroflexota bacterium]
MRAAARPFRLDTDPLWYRDAIVYEVHVRAFCDSDADGIGDFRGLTEKLDYLRDLGVTALWVLPFYPSPLKDDGYDIADYNSVNPSYGSLRDFKQFVSEAHRRGLRVITELVANHTSDQHPWFQRARHAAPGTSARNFYVWSDTPERYKEARIIFKDFETSNWTWDSVAQAYYWHRFYSHQPDLNYDNPQVQKAIVRAMDFWLEMGVDGLRLDAVPYLYEREGTNCENLPETHAFLKALRAHLDQKFEGRMMLAEANQWPEQAVVYFGEGDEANMAFHFPVMPRMFMAIRMEDRFPIIDILAQTPPIPDTAQWALFLRNHDELTLEMVTDEERDYMYRVYGRDPDARINLGIRRRLAPLLGNDRRRIELMNALLFSLPGTPVLYYGDEIGMGDNFYLGDRNGVRTPMQWSADRNAGFSQANPQRLYLPVIIDPEYSYETVNVQTQDRNPHSLLWWMKRLIALRKRYRAFGRGSLEFLYPENRKILAFIRRLGDETILVVANLSRFVQYVELNLAEFKEMVPVELFGQTDFPPIGDLPYLLTLGPHSFYWFALMTQRVATSQAPTTPVEARAKLPLLSVAGSWEDLVTARDSSALREVLPGYFRTRRWFGQKARRIKGTQIVDAVAVPYNGGDGYITLVQVDYTEGDPDTYALPLAFASGDQAAAITERSPRAVVTRLKARRDGAEGVLYDALSEPAFCEALLDSIAESHRLRGSGGKLLPSTTRGYRRMLRSLGGPLEPSLAKAEQSNTSVIYGDRFILKFFRRLEAGTNPDVEIGRFLTERGYQHAPPLIGALEYQPARGDAMTLALLQELVPNEGDAWQYTLGTLGSYFERVLASQPETSPVTPRLQLSLVDKPVPPQAFDVIGGFLETARLLGQRTAEMHQMLASDSIDPDFAPEPFTMFYQRGLYQSMRNLTAQTIQSLRKSLREHPEQVRGYTARIPDAEPEILRRFRAVADRKLSGMRIRHHGDYHLGQVLYTGNDFVIIDFEGEPARPLSQRRIKRSALADVAGMLRSFHYVSHAPLFGQVQGVVVRPEDLSRLEGWARFWSCWTGVAFLKGYMAAAEGSSFLPRSREEIQLLLDAFLLEKAVYELGYELNHRPTWVAIPARGILDLL